MSLQPADANAARLKPTGWNLRWRSSQLVESEKTRGDSNTIAQASSTAPVDGSSVHIVRSIQQAAAQVEADDPETPRANPFSDPFRNPFGDPQPQDPPDAAPQAQPLPAPGQPSPAPSADAPNTPQVIPPNDLERGLPPRFELPQQQSAPQQQPDPGQQPFEQPEPQADETPSREREAESPSDRATESPEEDRRSFRDRLRMEFPGQFNGDSPAGAPADADVDYSCDELRAEVRARTIDRISLDISPPYRPDIIDSDQYKRVRQEFDRAQTSRQWRGRDGQLLAEGTLTDISYHDAVIERDGMRRRISLDTLSEADIAYVTKAWGLPQECLLALEDYEDRQWIPITFTWKASALCHKPLYFEEVNLERYGHTMGPFAQPVFSSAHFFVNIAVMPYKMGIHPPNECRYALGYYRPGNCAPWLVPPVPLSLRGALTQTAAVAGGILLIP